MQKLCTICETPLSIIESAHYLNTTKGICCALCLESWCSECEDIICLFRCENCNSACGEQCDCSFRSDITDKCETCHNDYDECTCNCEICGEEKDECDCGDCNDIKEEE